MSNCDQFREMYEAYALGALDAAERAAFEAHLASGCANCAKAVEEARWFVSQLAYLAPEAAPSDMLKGRLIKTIRAEAAAAKRPVPAKRAIPVWLWALWAAAAALLIFTAYSNYMMRVSQAKIAALKQQTSILQKERDEAELELLEAKREATILTDPASVKIHDPKNPQLEAMWHSEMGIVLMGQRVPMPAGKRVLQLWLIPKAPGSKPMPSITMRPDADGKLVMLVANPPELLAQTKALAITEEPEGGSLQPTSTPTWVGGVS